MKKIWLMLALIALGLPLVAQQNDGVRRRRLEEHVRFFASDSLRGRSAGTADARKATEYIIGQFESIGLSPFFDGWYQPFMKPGFPERDFRNVVALIPGSDPSLKDQYIVVGAHYDHLGVKNGQVYNGADDNASGTAALIELARDLKNGPSPGRSIVLAAFDAEELGLLGSMALAKEMKSRKDSVVLMMSVDMVGWLKEGKALQIQGVGTIGGGAGILGEEARRIGIPVEMKKFESSILTATDTEGFACNGVPTLAVTTGLKSPYHKPGDDADLIDYDGLDKVTEYLGAVTGSLASSKEFSSSGRLSFKHESGSGKFELQMGVGVGHSNLNFPNAAFDGKSGLVYGIGVYPMLNLKKITLRTGLVWSQSRGLFPDESSLFGSYMEWRHQELTVPLDLLLRTPSEGEVNVYLGPEVFYSRVLSSSFGKGNSACTTLPLWQVAPNQYGWGFVFGSRAYVLDMQFVFRRTLGDYFLRADGAPEASVSTAEFRIVYDF